MNYKIITGLLVVPALLLTLTTVVSGDGAAVINYGKGKPTTTCNYYGLLTEHTQAVLRPDGSARLTCLFSELDPVSSVERNADFSCGLAIDDDFLFSSESSWLRTPSGQGKLTCVFPAP